MGGVHGRRNEIESTLVIGDQKQEERRIQQFEHEESQSCKRQRFQMRRKKLEVIVSGLWPSGNWDKGKGKLGAEYSVDETGVTTASRGEKI